METFTMKICCEIFRVGPLAVSLVEKKQASSGVEPKNCGEKLEKSSEA
jgi:hypothetical protein